MDALASSNTALTSRVSDLEAHGRSLQQELGAALHSKQQAELELEDVRERGRRDEAAARAAVAAAERSAGEAEGRLEAVGAALKEREGELELSVCR